MLIHIFRKANKTEDPNGFYSSTTYTTRLLDYFKERTPEDKEKPFFAYYPFTAPHWPLQCTKAKRDKYKGRYDSGPFELRKERLAALKKLGIIDKDVVPHEVVPLQGYEWDTFDDDRKKLSARAMECYAGMVEMIDDNVGRVLEYLKETGEYDNTCIVFMSDNGAEGAAVEAYREQLSHCIVSFPLVMSSVHQHRLTVTDLYDSGNQREGKECDIESLR